MTADLTKPKNIAIIVGFWLFMMLALWKFNIVESTMDLTGMKIIISIVSLPVIAGIIFLMGND